MSTFLKTQWYSERVRRHVTFARWGHFGQPVLIFPTAGGDAEEIERFLMIRALEPLIRAGRIKVYSCDSVAGQVWFERDTPLDHRMWMMNQFEEYVRREVVPAIYMDCHTDGIPIWTAGASIGAMYSVAAVCRYPEAFHRAIAMSGTYDILRFANTSHYTHDYFLSVPMRFLPHLDEAHLDLLRQRFILLASGEGRAENMEESWAMARMLGEHLVPNWVDPWGPAWHHDWPTWRAMLPKYLDDWTYP